MEHYRPTRLDRLFDIGGAASGIALAILAGWAAFSNPAESQLEKKAKQPLPRVEQLPRCPNGKIRTREPTPARWEFYGKPKRNPGDIPSEMYACKTDLDRVMRVPHDPLNCYSLPRDPASIKRLMEQYGLDRDKVTPYEPKRNK